MSSAALFRSRTIKGHTVHVSVGSFYLEQIPVFFFISFMTFLKSLGWLPCGMPHNPYLFDRFLMIRFKAYILGKILHGVLFTALHQEVREDVLSHGSC